MQRFARTNPTSSPHSPLSLCFFLLCNIYLALSLRSFLPQNKQKNSPWHATLTIALKRRTLCMYVSWRYIIFIKMFMVWMGNILSIKSLLKHLAMAVYNVQHSYSLLKYIYVPIYDKRMKNEAGITAAKVIYDGKFDQEYGRELL